MEDLVVALAQINSTVGALRPNAASVIAHAHAAAREGARLIVFPELALSGYPPEDLVLRSHFVQDCEYEIDRTAAELPPEALVLFGSPVVGDPTPYNGAIACAGGKRIATYRKLNLPNYGVFDEKRVFQPGRRALVLVLDTARIGVHICEDSWCPGHPASTYLKKAGLDFLVNLSASPYHRGKLAERTEVIRKAGDTLGCAVAYCNLVGGQDELVFDGASMAVDRQGQLMARAVSFSEEILLVPMAMSGDSRPEISHGGGTPTYEPVTIAVPSGPLQTPPSPHVPSTPIRRGSIAARVEDTEEVYTALTLGLRDYVDKNGFQKALVALSGGIDSALVATLAVDALGRDRVVCVTMPSEYSSRETVTDALQLARNLGVTCHTVPIKELFENYNKVLSPLWADRPPDITEENLQARIRGTIVMAISNKFGWLVLATGNKSEMATGYCTLYGDMVGGFAVIKDVPKTLVFALARWRNRKNGTDPFIPPSIIERPPSAELKPDQRDTDTLPAYEVLDPILERYIEDDMGIRAIASDGHDLETAQQVARMVDSNEYKRRQGPPGIKITPKAFGRDRRLPMTNQYRERD